ncbi:MAG: succinate dehydrogenase, hydrophobic membrane anchor protein [Parvularculaceae bacterium]
MTHKGTKTFIAQRGTAVLMLPLVMWFLYSVVANAGASHEEVRAWLAGPLNAALMAALIVIGCVHMRIGLNEIIDDYIDGGSRGVVKLLNLFACLGAALLALFSLFTLAA